MPRTRSTAPDESSRPVELLLALDRSGALPLRRQLESQLRGLVREGKLRAGSRLPSTRALAASLAVSRGVVVDAYDQLAIEGVIALRDRAAPRVAAARAPQVAAERAPQAAAARAPQAAAARAPQAAAARAGPDAVPPTRAAASLTRRPARWPGYDFTPTSPDVSLFPRREWRAAWSRALTHVPDAALDYGDGRGAEPLRDELARYLARVRGVVADGGDVVVVSGFSQALELLARALASSGVKRIALEDPCLHGQASSCERAGLEVVGVAVDADGIRVDELRRTGARAAVVAPAHQFPTGAVLSPRRRRALLEWAAAERAVLIEDDYDAEFRYDRRPVGALQGMLPERVAYAGTASKQLAPTLRLGWVVAPAALRTALAAHKWQADGGSPGLDQHVYADQLARGTIDRHLQRARATYRRRRDLVVAELRRALPHCGIEGAAAGLHLVLTLPALDEARLAVELRRRALRAETLRSYALAAGEAASDATTRSALVLGYGRLQPAAIGPAVRALAEAIGAAAGR